MPAARMAVVVDVDRCATKLGACTAAAVAAPTVEVAALEREEEAMPLST